MNPYQLFAFVPLFLLRSLAKIVAHVLILLPNLKLKRVIETNLTLAYPQLSHDERHKLRDKIIINQALTSVESAKAWAMPPDWAIAQIQTVHNADILQNALADPKGMLAVVPHLGNWEMMNAWLNQFGSPTILYKPIKGKLANEFVLNARSRQNATLVPTDASGVKAVFATLKQGGFTIILPDHVPDPKGGVVVPFFGIDTLTGTLTAKLAQKTGCSMVGLTCLRNQNGKFEIFCYDVASMLQKTLGNELKNSALAAIVAALNNAMEAMITHAPTDYMWGYKRFKGLAGEVNVYELGTDLDRVRDMLRIIASKNNNSHTFR